MYIPISGEENNGNGYFGGSGWRTIGPGTGIGDFGERGKVVGGVAFSKE